MLVDARQRTDPNAITMESALATPPVDASSIDPALLANLQQLIATAAELLPAQGPITAFAFLNTLQGLEDTTFEDGVRKGSRLFDCQSYLTEGQYQECIKTNRIRVEDLEAILREDLAGRADQEIAELVTRCELRLAMLKHPLWVGPDPELRWFVAETNALRKFREEAPNGARERFLEATRRWVMRDLREVQDASSDRRTPALDQRGREVMNGLFERFGEDSIESWSPAVWEEFSLKALWQVCSDGVRGIPPLPPNVPAAIRHRDFLLEATGQDSDILVHEVLIRFCASYCDQGFNRWSLPRREQGFVQAFYALHGPGDLPDRRLQGLAAELARLQQAQRGPLESVLESLEILGVEPANWQTYLSATLLALRGWAGIIWQMESRGDRVAVPAPPGTLVEFLAIRLILERLVLSQIAQETLGFTGPLTELCSAASAHPPQRPAIDTQQHAFLIFQLAQVLGWSPPQLFKLTRQQWNSLVTEVEVFSSIERRRMLHEAYERRYRVRALDALSIHCQRAVGRVNKPRFQAVFCIDTREESFRRHLEEIAPDTETFGAAGFFGVAMYYRGAGEATFDALCPIVIRPQHWVVEDVVYTLDEVHRRRAMTRKVLGTASHQFHLGTRTFAGGALLTAGLGVLATIPLTFRVLFPRLTARIRRTATEFVAPPRTTRLRLERSSPTPGPEENQIGFTVEEMADRGERMLRDIGLTENFSRLVMFFGHGSFCLNNPHKSCYDCGACSGSAGAPNARALAAMLNDPRVRNILASRNLKIPHDTVFLGGLHNTCSDEVEFLDLDLLPQTHFSDFTAAAATLQQVCERNAHERCRRFESAPLNLSPAAARRHVEARSEDLAQVRPEYGNASNAMCFVGRRSRVRQLYMDRRCFMHSYDPTTDDAEGTILGRILGAVVIVCSGINLQYYFSYVDNTGYGSGTKLPHNISSLLGVMDGAASDLRSGLPWQGIEIHEPMRCLFVMEAKPEVMLRVMDRNPAVSRILCNGWGQLALLDPESNAILVFRHNRFTPYVPETTELSQAESSHQWYRGWRDHLGFAQIGN